MKMTNIKRIWAGALLFMATAALGDPNVSCSANRRQISQDESLRYTVRVENANDCGMPELGSLEGWQIMFGPSTSRQTSIVNGKSSSAMEYQYELKPLKTGTLEIGEGKITADGRAYKLLKILVDVKPVQAATKEAPKEMPKGGQAFIEVEPSKDKVYLGEKFYLTLTLYFREVNLSDVSPFRLVLDDFNSQDLGNYDQGRQRFRGEIYNYIRLQKVLTPLKAGEFKLGPVSSDLAIQVPVSRQRRSNDFFDDPFSMFERYERVSKTVTSEAKTVTVLDLPSTGRPANYKGAIGRFDLQAEISPLKIKEGESVTLKCSLTGNGNFDQATLDLCQTNTPCFRAYDPEVRKEGQEGANAKFYSQMWLPIKAGENEIPAVSFSYFDVDKNEYVTLTKGPFPISVEKSEASQKVQVSEALPQTVPGSEGASIRILNQDIFGLKSAPARALFASLGNKSVLLTAILVPPAICLLALLLAYRLMKGQDVSYTRRSHAYDKAQKALKTAAKLADGNDCAAFCASLSEALLGYVADTKNVSQAQIGLDFLAGLGLPKEVLDLWNETMPSIEMARFSGLQNNRKEREALLAKSAALLKELRRNIR